MQKIGWAAQLDGPGPKASVPLGSVHAWLEWDAFCIHILHTNAYHTFCGKKGPHDSHYILTLWVSENKAYPQKWCIIWGKT